jgi:hypothetical protein
MTIISIYLSDISRKSLKDNSIIKNYPSINYYYFLVPSEISEKDRDNFCKQGISFLSAQFNNPIENLISINDVNYQEIIQMGKELSWDVLYQYDSWIQVRSGVFDDELGLDISGFIGRIIGFFSNRNQNLFQIAYSGNTISKIKINPHKSKFVSPFYTILETDLILPSVHPDDIHFDENLKFKFARETFKHQNIFPESEVTDLKYLGFYRLIVEWEYELTTKLPKNNHVWIQTKTKKDLLWTGIHNSDQYYGIWGKFEKTEEKILLPLTDIEKIFNNNDLFISLKRYKKFAKIFLPN